MRLSGKVAVITGAARGIGRAVAERFREEGARLVVNDVDTAALAPLATAWEAVCVVGSVDEEATAQALVRLAQERYGRLDILVNNAAVMTKPNVTELTWPDWERTLAINVGGLFLTAKYAIPVMIAQGGGSIVNLGSTASVVGFDAPQGSAPAYVASKGAVLQLTRSLAVTYGKHNIRVNCVCPGSIMTDMSEGFLRASVDSQADLEALRAADAASHALGRLGTPREIAHCVLFLASDEASFVTGAALMADGGNTAM